MHKISTRFVCVNGKHRWISVVVSNCTMGIFGDAIASRIGYCEFGQETWSKFVSQNSHCTDQSFTITGPKSEMCIFCGALLYFCTKNKVVVVVVVCKRNEVRKSVGCCAYLYHHAFLQLYPPLHHTPSTVPCLNSDPLKLLNCMIVQLVIFLLTGGRVTPTFFSLSVSVWMLSQNNTTVLTLYFKEHSQTH